MAALSDLPLEVLKIILQALPPSTILSMSCVSKRFYDACRPVLYASFTGSAEPKKTWRRFQSFLNVIIRDDSLGPCVQSVLIDNINDDDDIAALQNSIVPLLSRASNIQQFAVPGHPNLLSALKRPLSSGDLFIQRLQAFQCVYCGPEIWQIIPYLPQLSRLSLTGLSCDSSISHLPASSLPIEHILLKGCNLGSQAICAMIRSCKHLVSFQCLRSPLRPEAFIGIMPLNASDIYEALLLHKDHLRQFLVQDRDYRISYNETPKFGSFGDFPALQGLGVDCNTLSAEASLPPSLRSVAIQHCSSFTCIDVLLHIGRHPSVEAIQFDDSDGGTAIFFQDLQLSGKIRKEIQVHLVSAYAAYARQSDHLHLVNDPLPWIGTPELG